jgi:hypothetical protein
MSALASTAIALGDPSYRTITVIGAAGSEADPPPPRSGDGGASAFLHDPVEGKVTVVTGATSGVGRGICANMTSSTP